MAQPGIGETAGLDAEELMHLALKAMRQDRDDEALLLLKRAVALEPDDGRLRYLLGALYAELGMTARALQEITSAVALAPQLSVASFQLGLLYLAARNVDKAQEAWQPLDQLAEDDALRIFKVGMTQFIEEDYVSAIASLQQGMALNDLAPSLNANMAQVVERARVVIASQTADGPGAPRHDAPRPKPGPPISAEVQHVLLAGYRKQEDKPR